MTPALEQIARDTAARHGLPPEIFCGLIERESNWNYWAVRYEPAFMTLYVMPQFPGGKMDVTEAYTRAMSWGLCQVMGQVARELGFKGEHLSMLYNPEVGVEYGARKLSACLKEKGGDINQALEKYNGGKALQYAAEVIALAAKYTQPPTVQSA